MHIRLAVLVLLLYLGLVGGAPGQSPTWWDKPVEEALTRAGKNRSELEKALQTAPRNQRPGIAFLVANMPGKDLATLQADFLLANLDLAYQARAKAPWSKLVSEELFLNEVLPYASILETREPWRKEMMALCFPMVKDCQTITEAAQTLNASLFTKLKVGYSTQRRRPDQSPSESIASGKASCTGLSILLIDACRSVGIPARLVGIPKWPNKPGNHTWVEIWDGDWHFTGACEHDKEGLNRAWFTADAALANKDSIESAIYAASFKRTKTPFPLPWAPNGRDVSAVNVTDRYAKKNQTNMVRVLVRVVNPRNQRVAVQVVVTDRGDAKSTLKGFSKDEGADTNDLLCFNLLPNREYMIQAGGASKHIKTGPAGEQRQVDLTVTTPSPQSPVDPGKSGEAIKALRAALDSQGMSLAEILGQEFATTPLSKTDAATARLLLWKAQAAMVQKERAEEIKKREIKDGNLTMPFHFETFGKKPPGGRSLWISLHGGGGVPKEVNDSQWHNQKKLYTLAEGIYLAPRAPTNTWNLWHQEHIDRLFGRLIEDLIVLEEVDPERVYVLGYSAGGDGVYQLAPRMADYWAGAAMMAGHPNGVPLLSLRNVAFALQVGANDSAYQRNKVGREYGEQLAKLKKEDPQGYTQFVKIHEGKGHWMNLEDKEALPWLAKFTRNSTPDRVVWKQSGALHDRSYWLAIPAKELRADALVIAQRQGQQVTIAKADKVTSLLIRLDDRMADLDRAINVTYAGRELFSGIPSRTIYTLAKTLVGRGDPKLMFDAEVAVDILGAP